MTKDEVCLASAGRRFKVKVAGQLGYTLSVDCSGEYALTFVWASLSCLLPVASVAGRQVCREAVAKRQWHWGTLAGA